MTHRVPRAGAVGLLASGLCCLHVAMAQETPVVTRLSSAHANTSPTYPLTLVGQAVAVRGDLAMVGVPEFETVDANGNPVSGGIVEMYEGNASGTQWTRTGSFLPPYPDTDGGFGVPRQPSRHQATLSTRQGTHVPCAGSKPITTCGTHKTSFYTSNRSLSSICRTQSTTHWSRSFGGSKDITFTPGKSDAPAPTALHEPNDATPPSARP